MTAVPRILEPAAEVSILTTGYELPPDIPYQANGRGPQWRDGVQFPYSCSTARALPAMCGPTGFDENDSSTWGDNGVDAQYVATFEPFIIEQTSGCGWLHRPIAQEALMTVLHDADILAPAKIARQLWSGDFYKTTPGLAGSVYTNPTLQDAATVIPSGGTAAQPVKAIGRLLEAVRTATGGKGGVILHGPELLVPTLTSFAQIQNRAGRYLGNGWAYSPGPLNPADLGGNHGPDGTAQSAGEVWVYATGRIEWALGPYWDGYEQSTAAASIDKRIWHNQWTNEWEIKTDRLAIVRFNPCAVFAAKVLVDAPASE